MELVDLPTEKTYREFGERYPDIKFDPAAMALGVTYVKIAAEIIRYIESYFHSHDLSDGRFTVLMLLMRYRISGGQTPSSLAERAGVTRATMTGLIDGLEKKGLVRRTVDETDKRKQTVELTSKGIKLIDKIYPAHLERMSKLLEVLTGDDQKALARINTRLRDQICSLTGKAKLNCAMTTKP